ncbi:short-chain dehydrogenase [Nocardioides baekrokdamisoli]|uniref:Short-chain dehydrogenase n=1 Tax=Nocardioides baekrokdamisoli TaxID=1804624 RepID=A0A3G9J1Y3_9ACTN|nr:SDR family oxidoreductase [Nocardioides baekrokdamisoli]BBH17464.1 short-chain dehydrogenase [Nocardioides baekrokdamisoli]
MSELDGCVALVTGGSSGIGEGASYALARHGAAVAVHGRDLAEAEGVAAGIRALGGRAIAVAGPIDVAQTSIDAVAATVAAFGRLDVLVTSAGIQRYGDAVSTTEALWDEVLDVNTKGVFLAANAALPVIRQSPGGSVVIVASVQGSASQANVVAYTTSKGALHSMGRAMAIDEAAYGVRVNTVSPGSVDTPMLRHSAAEWSDGTPEGVERTIANWGTAHALGRVASIDEVGEVIAFLSGSRASFITGSDVRVDGGLLARIAAALPEKE